MKSTLPQDRGFFSTNQYGCHDQKGKGLEVQVFSFLIVCYDSPSAEAVQKGKATPIIRTAKFCNFQHTDVAHYWVMH